jgi:protein dithiol oxidoreductase (disulfide-forming)
MKNLLKYLLVMLSFTPFGGAYALQQGQEYVQVARPVSIDTGTKIEVREFFWYGCPHCYSLEPEVASWLKKKPANVTFIRTPATIGRWMVHAQAYYAFEAMGALEKLHTPFFNALHPAPPLKPPMLMDEASIAAWVGSQGLDPTKFREAFNSFGVKLKLEKARKLNEALVLESVPTFVIDGKYMTSPSRVEGADFMAVVNELAKKAAAERKGAK